MMFGRAFRSERWLSWIATFKFVKATFLLATAVAAVGLLDPERAERMSRWAMVLAADRHYGVLETLLRHLAEIDPRTMRMVGVGSFSYAMLFYAEGIGLFLRRRWAEYMTIVTTGALIPFELFEIQRRITPGKLGVLAANVCILVYLAWLVSEQTGSRTPKPS
jgi:uncharacterized membrane protein (DUF2068 family)